MENFGMAKGPFMEFLRGYVTTLVADTYNENTIATPASKTELFAMLIHEVFFEIPYTSFLASTAVQADCSIHKASKTNTCSMNDPDFIARGEDWRDYPALIGGGFVTHVFPALWEFDPPILYAKDVIYFGVNTTAYTAVRGSYVRIGYTLEKVSREEFIQALVD